MQVAIEPQIDNAQVLQAQANWRKKPLLFASQFFSPTLWQAQEDILDALTTYKRVAVKSGNTIGKSYVSALVTLWFLLSHYPSKVIITAPTFNQIENILWKEIANLYNHSKIPIGGELLKTELKFNDEWFALGISTDEVNRFQGFHSPYLLVILDEALGINPIIWEAIEGLHPYRILAIGNPLSPEGEFYKCFSSGLWHKVTVSCPDCVKWQNEHKKIAGLVDIDWIEERQKEWGVKSPLYQARVLGEFPQEGTDTLIHLNWVDKARTIELDILEDFKIVAADIARYGEDKTVIIDRNDHSFYKIEIKEKIPTTMTSGIIKRHYERELADSLVVDDSGVGGGVTDMLSEQKIGVLAFNGGAREVALDKNHFKNLRSQFYWITARKFEKGLYSLKDIPQKEFEILKSQLCSIKYTIQSDGRIAVESKDDMKARGLNSPDLADALMMSEYAYVMGKQGDIRAYRYR